VLGVGSAIDLFVHEEHEVLLAEREVAALDDFRHDVDGLVLWTESIVMTAFAIVAVLGFKSNSLIVAIALAGHGVFDALHDRVIPNSGVPAWWPSFCLAFDVGAAGCVAFVSQSVQRDQLWRGRSRAIILESQTMKVKDHAGVYVPPPLLFVLPLVTSALLHAERPWVILEGQQAALALGAFFTIATGVAIGVASVAGFKEAKTTILPAGRPTTAIVDKGPYAFTRNPMYLAMASAYLGLSLLLNSMWAVLLLPLILVVIDRLVIRREERYLTVKFGEPYREYCARVRRWI
jgi:protein-S-isoprenylcysteine O-methyltransferase Ste14